MPLGDELRKEAKKIYGDKWTTREGQQVPNTEDLKLGNDAVLLKGTVLYADLADSTALVDKFKNHLAAEVYKTYLLCAARIIRAEGGEITAYDGDRIMAVFLGNLKNTSAAKAALKINYAVTKIVNTLLREQYPDTTYAVQQAVGIDTSSLFVARTGIRGANDLVWVGRAANYAAKLCSLRSGSYASWITKTVYDSMNSSAKNGSDGRPMWEEMVWKAMGGITIYRSGCTLAP